MHRFIILEQGVWWGRGDSVPDIIDISTIITNINNIITTTNDTSVGLGENIALAMGRHEAHNPHTLACLSNKK